MLERVFYSVNPVARGDRFTEGTLGSWWRFGGPHGRAPADKHLRRERQPSAEPLIRNTYSPSARGNPSS